MFIVSTGCATYEKNRPVMTTSYTGIGSPYHFTVRAEKQSDLEKRGKIREAEMLFQTRP